MMRAHLTSIVAGAGIFGVLASSPGTPVTSIAHARAPRQVAQGQRGRGGAAAAPAAPDPKQVIEGTDEDDSLNGGTGDDWIFGKKGNDYIVGRSGRDTIDGSDGDDVIEGGPDADIVDGAAGSDTIRGNEGDDRIEGSDDDDTLDGGDGVDDIDGGDGNDTLRGGAGNDVLAGGDENDALSGGAGNDRLSGDDDSDNLLGGAGDDALFGGEGDDSLDGEPGNDRLDGGDGNDVLRGGAGNDFLLGSNGDDTLLGAEGHDTIVGGDGIDTLNGGGGADWILGGSGADLVLGGDGDDLIVLRAGDVAPGEIEAINGGAGDDVLILNGFGEAQVTPSRRQTGIAESELIDPITGGLYRILNVERTEFTLVTTRFEDQADRPVSLTIVNPAAVAATGRVMFFRPDGSVAPIGGPAASAAEVLPFNVPPLGSVRLEAIVDGPVTAQLFSSTPLGATIVSGTAAARGPSFHVTGLLDSAIIPVLDDPQAGTSTGVLIANSVASTNVKLTLHRLDGSELDGETFVGSKEVALAPYAHVALFVRDLFPTLGTFRGALSVDDDASRPQEGGPVSVTVLERGRDGAISAIPAVQLMEPVPGGRVHIPAVMAGGNEPSSIVVMNASRSGRSQGTLRFFDENGAAWMVAVNRQTPVATVPYDLAPQGSLVLNMPAGGPVVRGSARADSTQGMVGALVRVPAGAPAFRAVPGAVFTGFAAAVRRDRTADSTTRLALASTGTAVTVQLTLRTASGADAPGGTAQVTLPANGQSVQTIEQLFPSAATDTFEGTVTATAEGGAIVATVSQTDGRSGSETPLPIARLP